MKDYKKVCSNTIPKRTFWLQKRWLYFAQLFFNVFSYFFLPFLRSIRGGRRRKRRVSKDISGVQKSGGLIAWLFHGRHGDHSGAIRVRLYREQVHKNAYTISASERLLRLFLNAGQRNVRAILISVLGFRTCFSKYGRRTSTRYSREWWYRKIWSFNCRLWIWSSRSMASLLHPWCTKQMYWIMIL